jgi:plasmid stabilization system protein ParE
MTRLTPDQAHYVITTLVAQRKLRPSQITRALRSREQEIRALRERLASLERMSGGGASAQTSRGAARRGRRPSSASAPVRRRKMSPKVRALRRLQGKYMGFVRGLKPAEKARVRSVREKQGMAAAIALASSLGGKR